MHSHDRSESTPPDQNLRLVKDNARDNSTSDSWLRIQIPLERVGQTNGRDAVTDLGSLIEPGSQRIGKLKFASNASEMPKPIMGYSSTATNSIVYSYDRSRPLVHKLSLRIDQAVSIQIKIANRSR